MHKSAKAATLNVQEQGQGRQLAFWDRFRITVNRDAAKAGLTPFSMKSAACLYFEN
jgi:hypothetical protein